MARSFLIPSGDGLVTEVDIAEPALRAEFDSRDMDFEFHSC